MPLRTFAFDRASGYPNTVFIGLATFWSFFALLPIPSSISIIFSLSSILIYSRIFIPSKQFVQYAALLFLSITSAGFLSKLSPSIHALSTPGVSLLVLFLVSAITSLLTIVAAYIDTRVCGHLHSRWSRITLFPTLWATLWFFVSYVSPLGRLSAWAPAQGMGLYGWMNQWVGSAGSDWVVAAWSVVCSQAVGVWFIGSEDNELLISHPGDEPGRQRSRELSHTSSISLLAALLVALALPSFVLSDMPLAVLPPDTTPFTVGCILPPFPRYKHHNPTLSDYIAESITLSNVAKILLWPEGAVTFNSETEKEEGLAEVQKAIQGPYVAVSFEETFAIPGTPAGKSSKRTGVAIVSNHSSTIHLEYYKRHLVPIAESFSLSHSAIPPSIFTLNLTSPKYMKKTDWAPGPSYTRPISLTASICLDFAHPLQFSELDSRPALILAPARTWDVSVGSTMWSQAKQRAEEMGSMVLWCDGGEGGVSGIAGGGFHDVTQVGSGSWVRTIGIKYPFDDHRTPYAYLNNLTPLILFWVLCFGGSISGHVPFFRSLSAIRSNVLSPLVQQVRYTLLRGRHRDEETSTANLIDV